MGATVYDFTVKNIKGVEEPLSKYRGKVLLIVNTASECGFTYQYEGLEKLYEKYQDQGLEVLGFPCNQFGKQEPGDEKQIENFCKLKFGVKFPLFAKIEVNGAGAHPLFEHLKEKAPGILGTRAIKWNFTKFLVNRHGHVLARFAPKDEPKALEDMIQKELARP